MKLIHKNIDKDHKGSVVLIAEESEDMWHAYNLINEGDSLRATTIRKVHQESATGTVNVNRVRTMLTICVESTDFDTQACVLRVKGRNIEENPYVKMGGYHTLDLEVNRKFTIGKSSWDAVSLERIEESCDVTRKADLAAIVMQEGLAHVCLVTTNMTLVRCKVEQTIPKKRKGSCTQRDKALQRFYDALVAAILRHVDFDVVKCVLVASPGFVKDQFYAYMMSTYASAGAGTGYGSKSSLTQTSNPSASSDHHHHLGSPSPSGGAGGSGNIYNSSPGPQQGTGSSNNNPSSSSGTNTNTDPARILSDNRSKFLLVHSASGFKHALREVLADPLVLARAADTKAAREVRILAQFTTMIMTDPDRAYYGIDHVRRAVEAQAVESLLITDTHFRSRDLDVRRSCIAMYEAVKENGGEVHLFSSLHVSGEQLDQLTGIAAILRYPMPEIEEEDDDNAVDEADVDEAGTETLQNRGMVNGIT